MRRPLALLIAALALVACGNRPAETRLATVAGSSSPPSAWSAADRAARVELDTQAARLWYSTVVWDRTIAEKPKPPAASPTPAPHSSRPPPSSSTSSGDACANPVIPEAVARRESGCNWGAYNPTGCGGRGCIGFYQIDAGHYAARSPWNPSTHGACYGLDPWAPADQTECASRLGPGAWG